MFDTEQRVQRWHGDRQGRRKRWAGREGLGGRLAFVVLAAVVVLFARDPEFRSAVWTFIRGL